MKYEEFEERRNSMATFEKVADLLLAHGFDRGDEADTMGGASFTACNGGFTVDERTNESISVGLHLSCEGDGWQVLLNMCFEPGHGSAPVEVQYISGAWRLRSDESSVAACPLHAHLLHLLALEPGAKKELTEAQAFDAIRTMAIFYSTIKALSEMKKSA